MNAKPRVLCGVGVSLLLVSLLCTSCGGKSAETPATGTTPSTATTSSAGPLLSLLAGIPADPIGQARDFIYFADYAAMASAYHATRPANAQEFANTEGSDQSTKVSQVLLRHAWFFSVYSWSHLETMPQTVGFSALEVDQAIQFGAPPSDGLMLAGSFDAAAVRTAYQTKVGLEPKDFDGVTVWCWGDDPSAGLRVDPANQVLENPFGGELGRRQPMTISDNLLMSSADLALALAHAGAVAGKVPSLADAPGYGAAVNAVGKDADILQATIADTTAAQQMASAPAYELLILADAVTGDEQIARLGLVYRDAESAESAAAILLDRLATYQPVAAQGSLAELLAQRNVTSPRHYVQQESDRAVLVLEFPAPKAAPEEITKMLDMGYKGSATPPGAIYGLFLDMFNRRDTGWLSTAAGTGL